MRFLPVVKEPGGMRRDPLLPPTEEEALALAEGIDLPDDFIFGAATSAYQVEGGIVDTNWNRWEDQKVRTDGKETVRGGGYAGKACDMWTTFETGDLPRIIQLGLKMFRFSVEWSRIEPKQGEFDEAAAARYVRWCRLLREAGIEPMVTLLHFTEPGWFVDLGGWEVPGSIKVFGDFCRYVVPRLAPHCAYWCTLNECVGCACNGWLLGIHPPGKKGAIRTLFRVLYHNLLAHREAADVIAAARVVAQPPAQASPQAPPLPPPTVLVANNVAWFEAGSGGGSWNPLLRLIAWAANVLFNFSMQDALCFGRLPNFPLPLDTVACLFGARKGLRSLRGSVNCVGVNNYARVLFSLHPFACTTQGFAVAEGAQVPSPQVKPGGAAAAPSTAPACTERDGLNGTHHAQQNGHLPPAPPDDDDEEEEEEDAAEGSVVMEGQVNGGCLRGDPHNARFEMSDMAWDLCPSSVGLVCDTYHRRYKLPVIVTENGIADGDRNDQRRVRYLVGCLRAVQQSIARGTDIRAYCYWSLLDNFEWAEGYRARFGIFRINYKTMARQETGGLGLYRDVIRRHRERTALAAQTAGGPSDAAANGHGGAANGVPNGKDATTALLPSPRKSSVRAEKV